jgi:hypothetical protein
MGRISKFPNITQVKFKGFSNSQLTYLLSTLTDDKNRETNILRSEEYYP